MMRLYMPADNDLVLEDFRDPRFWACERKEKMMETEYILLLLVVTRLKVPLKSKTMTFVQDQ